jgi:hypothetical protein
MAIESGSGSAIKKNQADYTKPDVVYAGIKKAPAVSLAGLFFTADLKLSF